MLRSYADSEWQQVLNNAAPMQCLAVLETGRKQKLQRGGKGPAGGQPCPELVSTAVFPQQSALASFYHLDLGVWGLQRLLGVLLSL